jgi:nitrogen fixation NifU-like protein
MSDLRELYQQVILDHNKNPRNFHELPNATKAVDGYNPLCGDHYKIYVEVDGDKIKDIGFTGNGCAISKASASVMSSTLKGKSTASALRRLPQARHRRTRQPQHGRTRAPRRVLRSVGVPGPRKVRNACMAYAEQRTRRR